MYHTTCLRDIVPYFEFSFWFNFIYHVKCNWKCTNTKRTIQKISSQSEQTLFLFAIHKVGEKLIPTQTTIGFNSFHEPKCHNLNNFLTIFNLFKGLHQIDKIFQQ